MTNSRPQWAPSVIGGGVPSLKQSFAPTALPGSSPAAPAVAGDAPPSSKQSFAPKVLPAGKPVAPAVRVEASKMPGVARESLSVLPKDVSSRFPDLPASVAAKIPGILSTISPSSISIQECVSFGSGVQGSVGDAVSKRMSLLESEVLRTMPRHLGRLYELLSEQAKAMQSKGLIRFSSPQQTWADLRPEVILIQDLLANGVADVLGVSAKVSELINEAKTLLDEVSANVHALDFALEKVPSDQAQILAGRQMAIASSQALLTEHVSSLELDARRIVGLVEQVQDGGLVKLPGLISAMADLTRETTETERFVLTEKLINVVNFLERK